MVLKAFCPPVVNKWNWSLRASQQVRLYDGKEANPVNRCLLFPILKSGIHINASNNRASPIPTGSERFMVSVSVMLKKKSYFSILKKHFCL